MPSIILLRHGQASFGATDYDALSDLGRRQAAVAGHELSRRALRDPVVVCGTLRRQRDTAQIAMDVMGLAGGPVMDGRWDEYDHVGLVAAARGAPAPVDSRSFQVALDAALADWIAADAADGWRRFADGADGALTDLVAGLEGRDAVVSTSGGIIAVLCSHLLGAGTAAVVALNRVGINAALTTLVAGGQGVSLVAVNDHAHLIGPDTALRTYR